MIYLDSCALVKLIRDEDGSDALQAWLDERGDELVVTSELAQAEVLRAVRRSNHNDQGALIDAAELAAELAEADDVLDAIAQVSIDRDLLARAGALELPMLRTLDAIHLVSALELASVGTGFVTYDNRLAAAARAAGLRVISPS
ncbi:type II toxin-antitoxin system VapC family toxin [Pseudonocardia sp. MH-G8]|uniref:type II toxin-antitoxin system VapC family toxin n=1 Tax=Pseudonocardia sp. MH-G8 TaxID=1854588 RepID=UPI000BA031EA|nr:type II toxin-antitoxin system VapC family toxin [Pseudonocardia sp. MH-G8]OZM82852.1 VapC toxin family PIN domain ribonuclease [Pseudonocardia sp. MH-G8]